MLLGTKKLMGKLLVAAATVLLVTGCETQPAKKKPGEKNAATAQWKAARAAVMITLAKDQYTAGNFDGSRSTVNEALKLMPDSAEIRILSARIAIENGNLDLAEAELQRAQVADPKMAAADYYYAVVMQRWQRNQKALELYTSASAKNPNEAAYVLAQAELMVSLDKVEDAVNLLKKAVGDFENSAEVRSTLGQVYLRQRKYPDAIETLKQAVMLAANDETIREQLARAYYSARMLPEATECFERLTKSEKLGKRADLFALLGECYLSSDRTRDARGAFESATELQPQNVGYLLSLAKTSLEAGDLRRADIAVRKALALQPADAQANLLLGYVRMEQNKVPEALAAFRRSALSDQTDTMAICMVGVALEKLDRRDEAAREYARALSIKPDDELARRLLNQSQNVASVDPDAR